MASVKAVSTDGTPAAVSVEEFGKNVAEVLLIRDEKGNVVKEIYKGRDGNPVISLQKKCASTRLKYDERGRLIEISFYGTADEKIDYIDGPVRIHRAVMDYNEADELKMEIFYDKNGKEVWRERIE